MSTASSASAATRDSQLALPLLGLTVSTGFIDAVSYLGLGHVFTANMTGNIVLLGFGLAGAGGLPVIAPVISLLAFVAGAGAGGHLAKRLDDRSERLFEVAVAAEAALVVTAAAVAALISVRSGSDAGYAVIALLAVAMGVRNAAVRRLAVRDLTTTVLTMTITALAAESPLGGGRGQGTGRRAGAVCSMLVGALMGALLVKSSLVAALAVAAAIGASAAAAAAFRAHASRRPALRKRLSKLSASGPPHSGCGAPLVSWRLTWPGRDIPPRPYPLVMDRSGDRGAAADDERAPMEATEIRGGRVLVVDDDPDVREAVETALELEGHRVTTATDGLAALKRLGQAEFDAVVLDVLMPNLDGFEVCRRLRASGNRTPILILTARDSEEDTIRGLDLGADDYLVKPFGLGELLARVRALLRRTRPAGEDAPLWFAGLSLDQQTREASRGGRRLELTRTEYALLELFLRNPRQVLTRELIMERVWNYDFGPTSNPLEVYISYLRRKTEAGGEPRLIHTVRGVGYALRAP